MLTGQNRRENDLCAQHPPRFLSTVPDRLFCCVPATPSSTSPTYKTLGTGAHLLGAPRRPKPSRPPLRATFPPHSCSLHPSFLPLPLPSTVLSFFHHTPHSFILPLSALPSSLCPSPCASLSRFYSPSRYLPPAHLCSPALSSTPSFPSFSCRCFRAWRPLATGHPSPGTGAPLPARAPRRVGAAWGRHAWG